MPRGSYTKAFLTTSVTVTSGAGAVGSSAMNVPLVAAGLGVGGYRGGAVGIQIWSIEIEFDPVGFNVLIADTLQICVIISQVPVTANMFVNNRDVIYKYAPIVNLATAVGFNTLDAVHDQDFYPAIPFYGQQLHLGVVTPAALGVSITVYCKVWYSMVSLSQGELVQQLQNQLT